MVRHDGVLVCVDAIVGVLRVNTWCTAGDPERFDGFILEVIVEMHVLAEDIFDGAAIVGLLSS